MSWRQLRLKEEDLLHQLHALEKEFSMVGITEQFDLSLILLRRYLCWDIEDIVYTPLKVANYTQSKHRQAQSDSWQSQAESSSKLDSRYRALNPNAYTIYEYFYRILMEKTAKEKQDDLKG